MDSLQEKLQREMYGWSKVPAHLRDDLYRLLEDPVRRLSEGPIRINSMRSWPFYLVLPIAFGVLGWPASTKTGQLAWIPAGFGFGLIVAVAMHWTMRGRLAFEPRGVVIGNGRREVLLPWEALAIDAGWRLEGVMYLCLPLEASKLDVIQLTKDGERRRNGAGVKTSNFEVTPAGEAKLLSAFELSPGMIAGLLLETAAAMTGRDGDRERDSLAVDEVD